MKTRLSRIELAKIIDRTASFERVPPFVWMAKHVLHVEMSSAIGNLAVEDPQV